MYAFEGDRIFVKDGADALREAEVISGDHPDGHPPYWVRWSDSGREALWFPPADADIEHHGPTYPPEYDADNRAGRSS